MKVSRKLVEEVNSKRMSKDDPAVKRLTEKFKKAALAHLTSSARVNTSPIPFKQL